MLNIKTWRDLTNLTAEMLTSATGEELNNLYNRIARPFGNSAMDKASYDMFEEDWMNKAVTNAYWMVSGEMDRRYKEENEPKVMAYFNEYFKGRTWDEIRNNEELYDRWGFYSDWHKDVYGYRPHDIVCGVYVSPY